MGPHGDKKNNSNSNDLDDPDKLNNGNDSRSRNALLQSWKGKGTGLPSQGEGDGSIAGPNDRGGGGGHRRSLSGSLLSKLSFLRFSRDEDGPASSSSSPPSTSSSTWQQQQQKKKAVPSVGEYGLDGSSGGDSSPGDRDKRQDKARKRKGSLRKTALLGTRHSRVADVAAAPSRPVGQSTTTVHGGGDEVEDGADRTTDTTSRATGGTMAGLDMDTAPILEADFSPALDGTSTPPAASLPTNSTEHDDMRHRGPLLRSKTSLGSPPSGELSTTDEDDFGGLVYQSLVPPHTHARAGLVGAHHGSESSISIASSSFPSNTSLPLPITRRHTLNKRPKSPLSTSPARASVAAAAALQAPPDEWDYAETEWWGWVVLLVTWLVFVVGMGSCLGVWSWAWDVGETPYAPPELEDDPTLPIVGYYPALIILTMVMAWVWVVVAWVGMKYFRHAKISGEDI